MKLSDRKKELFEFADQLEENQKNQRSPKNVSFEEISGGFRFYLNTAFLSAVITAILLLATSSYVVFREPGDYFISTQDGRVVQVRPYKIVR